MLQPRYIHTVEILPEELALMSEDERREILERIMVLMRENNLQLQEGSQVNSERVKIVTSGAYCHMLDMLILNYMVSIGFTPDGKRPPK